jgi:hypothetical protein
MELRCRSSRLNKLTAPTKILTYLALVSLIGCGIDGKDREEVGRFIHREQFIDQYLTDSGGSYKNCLAGTSWDIGQDSQESYAEYSYSGEPDIVMVYPGLKKLPPLIFRVEEDGVLVPDARLTQRQLDVHGC